MEDTQHDNAGNCIETLECRTTKAEGCPGKGGIRDDKLREACARALRLDAFDEQVFLNQVDFISVPESYKVEIHMKDGAVVMEDCTPTGHQDCWTEEYRAKASAARRSRRAMGKKGTSCLTCKIKCGSCGCNYQVETKGSLRYWRCRTNRDGIPLREDVLMSMIADVMGTETFNEDAVTEQLDSILVQGNELVFRFSDGHEETRTWVKPKRRSHKHTEEYKEHMRRLMKERWTPERKEAMSEKMKTMRKEEAERWQRT